MSGPKPPPWLAELTASAAPVGEDTTAALTLCRDFGALLPLPGGGDTSRRWSALAAVAEQGLTAARVLEAHTDALAILAEAGHPTSPRSTWGVFAAEAAGVRLDATDGEDIVTLSGTKPWCSLAGELDAALVTAHQGERRRLFRVDLRQDTVRCDPPQAWVARGLRTVTSAAVHFAATPATPVGQPEWYLRRAGFAWGGIGVAACWHGGARALGDTLQRYARQRGGELNALHVGIVERALHASGAALADAARQVDAGASDPAMLAMRTRAVVAEAAERVLHQVGHALGPAPLAFDADHAARVADLTLYVRQHHAERDLAALGAAVLQAGPDES